MPQDTRAGYPPSFRAPDFVRYVLIPLTFIVVLPILTMLLWLIVRYFDGSVLAFAEEASLDRVIQLWPLPSVKSAAMLGVWITFQALLLLALPGRWQLGPVTPAGDRVAYKLNGVPAFLVTVAAFSVASSTKWFSLTVVYDRFGEILMTCSLTGILGSFLLYFKGVWAPSTRDAGSTGRVVWDYYWGMELHPRIIGIDIKQLGICRLAMMGWVVILLSCVAKQTAVYGHLSSSMAVSVGLQLLYIFKFFWWEGGYFNTLDIMHYRLGFRNFWGVMAWLPAVYPLAALFLVHHPGDLSLSTAVVIVLLGVAAIWANYDADAQRHRVRATAGRSNVWGRPPAILRATYQTSGGVQQEALLLMSGWWGLARHFHYVSEIVLAVSWTMPAGFDYIAPWFYVGYLGILLVHRAGYDDRRCQEKYGHVWKAYCERVRYRVIPFVY